LGSARHHDRRLELAMAAIETTESEQPLIVFPAGFLRVQSPSARDALALEMLKASAAAGAAVVFGVDVATDTAWEPIARPAQAYVFACEAGERRLWAAEQRTASGEGRWRSHSLELWGQRTSVLLGAEVFCRAARRRIDEERPELILVLTHTGPTDRWTAAFDQLRKIAPVISSGAAVGDGPPWEERSGGWLVETVGTTRSMAIY